MRDDVWGAPIEVRGLFPLERAAMTELLSSLDPAEWRTAALPGWTVADVVAHVVHDQLRRLSGGRDGHRVDLPPGDSLAARLNRANEEFVAVARQVSPEVLLDLLTHLGTQLDAYWADLDLSAPAGLDVSWAGTGTPAWLDVAREYTEYWVHQQQVRDTVGRPGADTPTLMAPVLDTFARAVPFTLRDAVRPDGTGVLLRVTGPAGGRWRAVAKDGRWAMDHSDIPPVDAALSGRGPRRSGTAGALGEMAGVNPADSAVVVMDQDAFWRLATRRIGVDEARERAVLRGDEELALAVTTLLAIVR